LGLFLFGWGTQQNDNLEGDTGKKGGTGGCRNALTNFNPWSSKQIRKKELGRQKQIFVFWVHKRKWVWGKETNADGGLAGTKV